MILICVNYMRGSGTEPVIDFGMRCAGFAVIIGLGLNAGNYAGMVIPIVTGVGEDLALAVSGGTASAGSLDQLALHYLKIIEEGYKSVAAQWFPANIGPFILYGFKAALIIVGLIPFLVAAALTLIVADVGSLLVAMVGPIFFAFLIFPVTRQYFSAWLNAALSYALMPVFVAVIALISVGISKEMLLVGSTLSEVSLKSVFLASIGNLILVFLIRQVSSLASALSAGGINAAMPGSIGTVASGLNRHAKDFGKAARHAVGGADRLLDTAQNSRNSIRKAG